MKPKMNGFSRQYSAALRTHVKRSNRATLKPAVGLGQRAMMLGLETLDLTKVHEQALTTLVSSDLRPSTRAAIIERAGGFFAETITPIEKTHRTALETNVRLTEMIATLNRRTTELAASNRALKEEVGQREAAEESLRKSERHYGRLLAQSRQMQNQLRLLSRQLLSAHEDERKMISRELHDVIAQMLSTISLRLGALKKEAALNMKGLEQSIARTQLLVQKSVAIVHQFARELRPTVLDDLGLVPALHTLMKGFRRETGIRVSLSAFAAIEQISDAKRTVLYRVAQEALNNVARHAQATEAEVKIQKIEGDICMQIKDNGKGFAEAGLTGKRGKRLGLVGMRERLEMVGGKFSIGSRPGEGTTVLARIPIKRRARKHALYE
jgi:signal transduction histidine kinase